MPTDPLRLEGTTIAEKYRLEKCVGVGGFAAVYKALHITWQRTVAVKVFRELDRMTPGAREDLVKSLVQEASVLAELSERDATICQARDIGTVTTEDGRWHPYLVLEWLEGTSLDRVLKAERKTNTPPRTVSQAIEFLTPIARALGMAHKRGVAHRDVKPANIFVMGDARADHTVKLLDFGIAKVVSDLQDSQDAFSETKGTSSAYTPTYAAPEQFSRRFGATGPWTDVYALSLIFVELVTGRPPSDGSTVAELAFAAIDVNRRPSPRARGANVTDSVEAVVMGGLGVEPKSRYQTMAEFWNMLLQASGDLRGDLALALAPTDAPSSRVLSAARPPQAAPVPSLAPPSSLTTGAPQQVSISAPAGKNSGLVLAVVGIAVLVLGSLAAVGVFVIRARVANSNAQKTVTSASAVASVGPIASVAVAPKFECPADMVKVPAGKFFMGSDEKTDFSFEKPAHQITLGEYCIDRFEVTAGDYKICSDQGDCKRPEASNEWEGISPREHKIYDSLCNLDKPDKTSHPMNCVDWRMSRGYCKAKKKRLPTEAEWEHAARGSDGRRYPWGDDLPTAKHLNACGTECVAWGKKNGVDESPMYKDTDGFENTAPVGSFPAGKTVFGAEDMVGNVWEWVYDNYAPYTDASETDPRGPMKGEDRVIRGGAWNGTDPAWVRPTFRYHDVPDKRSYGIGFRCALSTGNDGS